MIYDDLPKRIKKIKYAGLYRPSTRSSIAPPTLVAARPDAACYLIDDVDPSGLVEGSTLRDRCRITDSPI
jgi:hypothetical protein